MVDQGNFSRTQTDLIATSPEGEEVVFIDYFTNFELPTKLKSSLFIEFLNEYNIAFILFVDVDETKANFIFSFLQNKIKFLTPGLNLSWFFLR